MKFFCSTLLSLVLFHGCLFSGVGSFEEKTAVKAGLNWIVFSENGFNNHVNQKKNIFVLVFADWCSHCQKKAKAMDEKKDIFKKLFEERGITPMLADTTKNNPEADAFLEKFGGKGVPFAVIFPKGDTKEPVIPDGSTVDDLIAKLSTF